jgi:hypothetical protein
VFPERFGLGELVQNRQCLVSGHRFYHATGGEDNARYCRASPKLTKLRRHAVQRLGREQSEKGVSRTDEHVTDQPSGSSDRGGRVPSERQIRALAEPH